MPSAAFLLVIAAVVAHSSWNFLAKKASQNKHLIWFSSICQSVLLMLLAIWIVLNSPSINSRGKLFLFLTGLLRVLCTESLLRGYRAGDFSVVYPVERGTGPLLSVVGAIFFLGEHPSWLATAGALSVASGVFALSSGPRFTRQGGLPAFGWGIATGLTIACYTLVDAYSVKVLLLSPILVD